MSAYTYRNLVRPIYEPWAIGAWLAAAGIVAGGWTNAPIGSSLVPWLALFCLAMALWRLASAARLYIRKKRLKGFDTTFIRIERVQEMVKAHPDMLWLGRGFDWTQAQRQLMADIVRADADHLVPREQEQMGQRWLHGIGEREHDILIPLKHSAGHMLVVGTTGSGKTRLLDLLISQAIIRGEAVVIVDPKGDKDLATAMRETCAAVGRPDDFLYFHPAFPDKSVRLDPMRNFARSTELATRVATLIPSETGSDPFAAFGQMAINNIVQGMLLVEDKPNLAMLRRFLEGGPSSLVVRACKAYFARKLPDWEAAIKPYTSKANPKDSEDYAAALITFYREQMQPHANLASSELEGLFSSFEHERGHFAKMVTSLMPILNMLTTGALGELLSPDHTDMRDPRPITDFKRVIKNKQALYIGLDSLSDVMVGSAIGALMLSDLTAVAGDRYNYGAELAPVNLFIDEAAEVINDPLIAMLNKGRGALMRVTVATQTMADFAARVGSEHKARMIVGNLNNAVALRILDEPTQEYITEGLPKPVVRQVEHSQSNSASSDNPLLFSGSATERLTTEEVDLVPTAAFGCLPDLEAFARVSAGRLLKIRVPILQKGGA